MTYAEFFKILADMRAKLDAMPTPMTETRKATVELSADLAEAKVMLNNLMEMRSKPRPQLMAAPSVRATEAMPANALRHSQQAIGLRCGK